MSPKNALKILPIGCIVVLISYLTGDMFNLPMISLNIVRIAGLVIIFTSILNLIEYGITKKKMKNLGRVWYKMKLWSVECAECGKNYDMWTQSNAIRQDCFCSRDCEEKWWLSYE